MSIHAELTIVDGDRTLTVIDHGDDYVDTIAEIPAPDADMIDQLTAADEQLLADAGYVVVGTGIFTDLGIAYEVARA